ncbi:YetF domain-containing protein [Janthinobacterium sp. 17J80-10]|uniref:DUF421 domain-containing protein n=1 Tax=Janthinobacterium sp. 17J80-10 TaxID=2497863 RepID=UPI0010058DBF|nr:YetF domain-containing protein [Janthinobacterium sp. 17J80-10]QAU34037.1 DUF421 domain-containing protein [Janthinobacterium sp. 17J80-10]
MNSWLHVDWQALFHLSAPAIEIIVRGTAVYWFLFFIFRFLIRRDVGNVGIADILLLVIVADASQNAMAGDTHSVSDGMLLVATLIGWNMLLDWLSYRFIFVRKFAVPSSLCLIKNGALIRRNLRRELISDDELWAKLREQGVADLQEVKLAHLEPDGEISIIKKE